MVNRYNPKLTPRLHYYEDLHVIPPGRVLLITLMGKDAAYKYERREWRVLNRLPRGNFRGGKGDGS